MSRQRIVRTLKKILESSASDKYSSSMLHGANDLPSVEEFVKPHAEELGRIFGMKGMFTSDPKTIGIAEDVFRATRKRKNAELNFFERNIFSQPAHITQETGSINVSVSDIRNFPQYNRNYQSSRKEEVMMCIGGPAAEDQSVMSSIIPQIRERVSEIIYATRDYKESNVNHAAKQSHARHGNALNADNSLTGHAIIPTLVMRKVLGVDIEDVLHPDYKKIDVEFTIDPRKLKIYFGNELNWLKQEYRKRHGMITEHDVNRIESMLSQDILAVIEGETNSQISSGIERSLSDSSSVHVTFTEKNTQEVEHENEEFKRVGIKSEKLTPEEIEFFFDSKEIHSAWRYSGDAHLKFNTHEINKEIAEKMSVKWIDGVEIKKILVTKGEDGNAKVAGVMTKDDEYFYASKLHFTGGYKVNYSFDKDSNVRFLSSFTRNLVNRVEDIFNLQQPLSNSITTSTGVSINAIFKKSDRIKRVIEKYGSIGEIAITNSHWTMIADDDDHVVVRITGGGNTGLETYNASYFLNVIANTRRLFGDDLIGILSTYGCPRAINARNSTEFAIIADGGIISYGKGGTGNTKRHAEAAIGLMMLGFDKEVVEYFNKFQDRNYRPLGDEISKIYEHIEDMNFVHNNIERTNRRMGYDKSLSLEEMVAIGFVLASAGIALAMSKKEKENKSETIEEIVETSVAPTSASRLSKEKSQQINKA